MRDSSTLTDTPRCTEVDDSLRGKPGHVSGAYLHMLSLARQLERELHAASQARSESPQIQMPKEWIEAAKCANCGGVGWTAVQVEAGVFDQEQCQWCFERWLALGQPKQLEEPK